MWTEGWWLSDMLLLNTANIEAFSSARHICMSAVRIRTDLIALGPSFILRCLYIFCVLKPHPQGWFNMWSSTNSKSILSSFLRRAWVVPELDNNPLKHIHSEDDVWVYFTLNGKSFTRWKSCWRLKGAIFCTFYHKLIWFFVVWMKYLKHTFVKISQGSLLTPPFSACLKQLCSKRPIQGATPLSIGASLLSPPPSTLHDFSLAWHDSSVIMKCKKQIIKNTYLLHWFVTNVIIVWLHHCIVFFNQYRWICGFSCSDTEERRKRN